MYCFSNKFRVRLIASRKFPSAAGASASGGELGELGALGKEATPPPPPPPPPPERLSISPKP